MSDLYDRQRRYEDHSKQLMKLCSMPERTTSEDLRRAATSLDQASRDIKELMNTQPKGCSCTRHEDDGRTWVTYDEKCQHHRWMLQEVKRIEANFKALESKLEDKLLVSLFQHSLHIVGRADAPEPEVVADRAMAIAQACLARLRK